MKIDLSSEQVQNLLFIVIDKRNDAERDIDILHPSNATFVRLNRTIKHCRELELILQVALKIREGDAA